MGTFVTFISSVKGSYYVEDTMYRTLYSETTRYPNKATCVLMHRIYRLCIVEEFVVSRHHS